MINQCRHRDPHIGSLDIQQEHQPVQARRGRGVELQLGIRDLGPVPHQGAVPGAQHTDIHLAPPHTLTCAAGWSAAGKSAMFTITCPAAEIARSAAATYDVPVGSSRNSDV